MIAMLTQYIDMIAKVIEFIGVMIMVLGLVFALYQTLRALGSFNQAVYVAIRQTVGKSILLGLEVLIAADIMRPWSLSRPCAMCRYWPLSC